MCCFKFSCFIQGIRVFCFFYIVIPTISNKDPGVNIYLCALASAAAHVAEFAAPAAPVLLALLHGTLLRREAEAVERLAADLTKYHLRERRDQFSHTGVNVKTKIKTKHKPLGFAGLFAITSCRPLLAQSRQTGCGVVGTEVRTLRPPMSQTFCTAQSSCQTRATTQVQ